MREQTAGPMGRRVELRRDGKPFLRIPPPLAVLTVVCGLKKPRLLLAGIGLLAATRTDVAVVCPNFSFSVRDTLLGKSRQAAENVHDIKDRLDDRFHDLREQGFHREADQGQRYFTIKL